MINLRSEHKRLAHAGSTYIRIPLRALLENSVRRLDMAVDFHPGHCKG